jgi:Tol biopolymer transport system component
MEPFIWSPDGHYIAFRNPEGPGFARVNIQDGSISEFFGNGLGPAWSPDGSKIAFYKSGPSGIPPNGPPPQPDISQGEWQLWQMNADGSGLTQLTFGGHNCCPIWVD